MKGKRVKLTSEQEEMAVAWAKKVGTPYVEEHVFAKNFHRDFSKKLGIRVKPGDVDYSEVLSVVEKERSWKANLSREQRKRLAAQRKTQREVNKKRYGYARVDGVQVEVANYIVEPSSIFMGKGKHPLRGRWKEGPREETIELNLSPDAPIPVGNWKCVVWQPDAMWIARWRDELTGKMKYVWLSESSALKQRNDMEKFDRARELRRNIARVQRHIRENINSDDVKRRKTATVSFLIDKLKVRVGDEKDAEEADTVGASTLRPEHIRFNGDGTTTFKFLGKGSVPHVFRVKLPDDIIRNLKEFAANANPTLFKGVNSKNVSNFLDEVMTGLSAKVFRTYYASEAVEAKLEKANVKPEDPEYRKKYVAVMANLEAAKLLNHRRAVPKGWASSLKRKGERLKARMKRAREVQNALRRKIERWEVEYKENLRRHREKLEKLEEDMEAFQRQLRNVERKGDRVRVLKKRISLQRKAIMRQKQRLRRLKTKHVEQLGRARQKLESRRRRDKTAVERLRLEIKVQRERRDYNLATSLKSYIDPRVVAEWCRDVDFNHRKVYSKALQRKFSWAFLEDTQLRVKSC